jgi:uncharacterized repeat protein (TIGR03843 family)
LQRLRPAALFDLLINNADRKGSHILIDPDQHLWLIDHGICFHEEDKLRTVIWDFAGEPFPDELCSGLSDFLQKLAPQNGEPSMLVQSLRPYLNSLEIKALTDRSHRLLMSNRFPPPNPYRRPYPWPQI